MKNLKQLNLSPLEEIVLNFFLRNTTNPETKRRGMLTKFRKEIKPENFPQKWEGEFWKEIYNKYKSLDESRLIIEDFFKRRLNKIKEEDLMIFFKFLLENNLLEVYSERVHSFWLNRYINYPEEFIYNGFWSHKTKEGAEYWKKVGLSWENYYQEQKN